jgi:alcohol dehydrogenase-like protein
MKAAIYRRYGPPGVVQLEDMARPVPKDNEILVRVHATTVCATDSRVRKAEYFIVRLFIGLSKPRKPVIAGVEFSGRVVQVGKDVSRFKVGDLVFGWPGRGKGTHVEYICMPEFGAVELKPANMSLDEAASIFCGGMTALVFLKKAKIEAGQNVLIYGASGAVGIFAVQLAKHFGARVTGVCGPTKERILPQHESPEARRDLRLDCRSLHTQSRQALGIDNRRGKDRQSVRRSDRKKLRPPSGLSQRTDRIRKAQNSHRPTVRVPSNRTGARLRGHGTQSRECARRHWKLLD